MGSVPGSGKSFGGGNSNPLQLSLPGETHRQRSLAGYVYGVAKSWIQLKQLGMHREAEGLSSGGSIIWGPEEKDQAKETEKDQR